MGSILPESDRDAGEDHKPERSSKNKTEELTSGSFLQQAWEEIKKEKARAGSVNLSAGGH